MELPLAFRIPTGSCNNHSLYCRSLGSTLTREPVICRLPLTLAVTTDAPFLFLMDGMGISPTCQLVIVQLNDVHYLAKKKKEEDFVS